MKTRGFYKLTGIAIILIFIISGLMHDHSIVAAQQNMDKIEGRLLEQFSTQDSADFIAVTRQDLYAWKSRHAVGLWWTIRCRCTSLCTPEFYSVDFARVTDRVFLPLALKTLISLRLIIHDCY